MMRNTNRVLLLRSKEIVYSKDIKARPQSVGAETTGKISVSIFKIVPAKGVIDKSSHGVPLRFIFLVTAQP
jgi:hypothetical protein